MAEANDCRREKRKENKDILEQKQAEKTYKIDEESLLEEILITIREYFSCTMVQKGNQAIFTFENGQRFRICVQATENKGEPMKRGTKLLAITAKKCRIEG